MDNREIDELLQELKNVSNWDLNHDILKLLSADTIRQIKTDYDDLMIGRVTDEIIKKVVTDFYAYNLYLEEKGKTLPIDTLIHINKIIKLKNEVSVVKYFTSNMPLLTDIMDGYFQFHEQSMQLQCRVIANVINHGLNNVVLNLYNAFFAVDLEYYKYTLPENVILGLKLIDIYKICPNQEVILNFLHNKFSNQERKNNFISYLLSNYIAAVMVYHKDIYDIFQLFNEIDTFVKYLQKQFSDDKFIINIFNLYFEIYKNAKRSSFVDIRDKIDYDDRKIIYMLDSTYKHVDDVMKDADHVYTIIGEMEENLIDTLVEWEENDISDNKKAYMLSEVLAGNLVYDFKDSKTFNQNNTPYFIFLLKLLLATYFYEYGNYKYDQLNDQERELFDYLDNDVSMKDVLKIFDDPEDEFIILSKSIEYLFWEEREQFLAKKKIISDNKIKKVLKFNQFMATEYRRVLGALFPFESSVSAEVGNWLLGLISDLIITSNKIDQDGILLNSSISKEIKEQCADRSFEEIVNFTISNVYEHIVLKKSLSNIEKFIIFFVESGQYDVRKLIFYDEWLGSLFMKFFELNDGILTDDSLRKQRIKTKQLKKINNLKKIDPYFDIDGAIIGNE